MRGSAGRALPEVDVVVFPPDTADEAVPLSRGKGGTGGEHVVLTAYLTRRQKSLNVSAATVRADRRFGVGAIGDHGAPPQGFVVNRVAYGSDSFAQAMPSACYKDACRSDTWA